MAFVDLDGDGNFDTAELIAGANKRLENMEKGNKKLKKDVAIVMKRIAETSKGVKQLAESMQKMADQQKDLEEQSGLEPPDPSGLLHALDIIEDELVALEKEREMVLDRYEKTVIHRLTNIHKECVVPSTKLVSAAGKKLKHLAKANAKFEDVQKKGGGPAAQLKSQEALEKAVDEEEESHQELVQKLIHIEFIKHDEMRSLLHGIAEAQLYFQFKSIERYTNCVKLAASINPDPGADQVQAWVNGGDGGDPMPLEELIAKCTERVTIAEKGIKYITKNVTAVVAAYEKQQNAVQKLAKTMQSINDDEVDLDPEDPSHLLRCLDLFEDELKDLEKERGFSISRLKKVALDRLKNLDKEGIKPMRELIQESKQVVKGKIAGVTKEEQRIKLADAIERLEFIKLDELKSCLYGISEAQLYFHCRGLEKYSTCVKLCLAIDPDAAADALEDVIGGDD